MCELDFRGVVEFHFETGRELVGCIVGCLTTGISIKIKKSLTWTYINILIEYIYINRACAPMLSDGEIWRPTHE